MKKLIANSLFVGLCFFCANQVEAVKPGRDVNPNGFPSGPHYNLNIIGKKINFVCPENETDGSSNVVFIPETGKGIQILMQSGKGKWAEEITQLQVIDPCAGFDGDGAVIQLPKNDKGYRVYGRALAKPTDNPTLGIQPELVMVQDEFGNDLIYLGLVTDNGFETPYQSFQRQKGKSTAIDISGLFKWYGFVCYLSPPAYGDYTTELVCGIDRDGDGGYEEIVARENVDGVLYCPEGEPIMVYCMDYSSGEWIFNIAELVEYLWTVENNGSKLIQVRFYPN